MLMIFSISTIVCASNLHAEGSDFWQCSSSDGEDKQWVVNSDYKRQALNKAFDACKKESRIPETCKTTQAACEAFINGVSTRPLWQCTALDRFAKRWISNAYQHRDDAAIAAKAYCEEQSRAPDSCYINLLTCRNLRA